MAYVDMAHSHVQRLLREAMELDDVIQDADGDYPFRHGTAAWFATVHPQGHLVRIWSRAVTGIRPLAPVLREVNALNARLTYSRAHVHCLALLIEAVVPVEQLTAEHLLVVCDEVADSADSVGEMLCAVHGGVTWFAEEATA